MPRPEPNRPGSFHTGGPHTRQRPIPAGRFRSSASPLHPDEARTTITFEDALKMPHLYIFLGLLIIGMLSTCFMG
jgi:hypothetical protein